MLVTAASGGVGSAIGQLLAQQGAARVIGGVRSPAQAATLAAACTPVTHGEGFVARALQTAGVPGFDIVLESIGGSLLASVLGGLAVVRGRFRDSHPRFRAVAAERGALPVVE